MLSLSTAFLIRKHTSWYSLLEETKNLGFSAVELNVQIPESWLGDIEDSVIKKDIVISSVHNYCPKLDPVPPGRTIYSGYNITSDDTDEQRMAVSGTMRTIEIAARFGAKAVVIHAGEVPTDPGGTEFFRYAKEFGLKGKLYRDYFDAIISSRKANAERYIETLMRNLEKCLSLAAKKNVVLCLENRYFYNEIPHIEEVLFLLDKFSGAPLAYWHDTGHAEVFVRLGFIKKHTDFLMPLHKNMRGMHLHDLHKLSDHHAPGTGDFDFTQLKPYSDSAEFKVVEAHSPQSTAHEVKKSIEHLKKTGIID